MINQKYIDLMNQEFDETNSPEQSRELEDYLNGHEEARSYYQELALALNVFEKVASLDPPPGLVDGIMTRLGDKESNLGEELVLGLVLFAGSNRLTSSFGPEQPEYVRGTANHQSWDLERGSEISEATLTYPGLSGQYRILRDGPDLRLHLELSSAQPAVIKFRHGPHTALQHYSSNHPTPSTLTASSSGVELNHEGDGSYDLVFRQDMDNQSIVTMLIFSKGGLIHTEKLDAPGK